MTDPVFPLPAAPLPVASGAPGAPARAGSGLPLGGRPMDLEQARAAAEEYEAVFIGQMLKHMFEGVETDPMFGGGPSEDIYRSMMVEEFGRSMASAGGVGLADQIVRSLISLQEVPSQ